MRFRFARAPGRGRPGLLPLGAVLGALAAAPVAAQGFYESNRPYFFGMGDLRCYGGMVDAPTGGTLRLKNGDKLIFDNGYLSRLQDLWGNFADVDQTGGRQVAIRLGGSYYPRIDFTYDGNGHITKFSYKYGNGSSPLNRSWT